MQLSVRNLAVSIWFYTNKSTGWMNAAITNRSLQCKAKLVQMLCNDNAHYVEIKCKFTGSPAAYY